MKQGGTIKAGLWASLDHVFAAVVAFSFTIVSARMLGMEEFGIGVMAVSLMQLIAQVIDTLFHDAIIQKPDLREDDVFSASVISIGLAVVLAGSLFLFAAPLAGLLNDATLASIFPWLSISLIFSGLAAVPAAQARREFDFRYLAIRTIFGRLLATAIALYLVFAGAGAAAIAAQYALSVIIPAILLLLRRRPQLTGSFSGERVRSLLRFGLSAMGFNVLGMASSRLVTLLMGALLGPAAAALWGVGLKLVEPIQILLQTIIGQLSLAIFSRRQEDRGALAQAFSDGTYYLCLFLLPAFTGLAICAADVVELFVGERWLAATPIVQIVCVATMAVGSRQLFEIALTAIGRPDLNLYLQMLATTLAVVLAALGSPFGLVAAALGWGLRAVPIVAVYGWLIRRHFGIGFAEQARLMAVPVAATSAMAAFTLLFRMSDLAPGEPVYRLLATMVLGVAVYVVTTLACDRSLAYTARAFIARAAAR